MGYVLKYREARPYQNYLRVTPPPPSIREGWATHFQHLATPMENPEFDQEYKQMVDADVEAIEVLCKEESSRIEPVSEEEVSRALKRLTTRLWTLMGLTSEYFKLAGREIMEYLTSLLNYIIMTKSISVVLKEGILTPIFKKGDHSNPSNYSGITVTPVYLKILEHIINTRHNLIFQESQSRLQKGFTAGCSSLNAALIHSECIWRRKTTSETYLLQRWIHRRRLTSLTKTPPMGVAG